MPKQNIPATEIIYLKEQKLLFNSSIFSYEFPNKVEKLSISLSDIDKKNVIWKAREFQQSDIPNYKKLLTNSEVVKYYYQERLWKNDEIEKQIKEWVNINQEGKPIGSLTILDEQDNFMGYVTVWAEGEGIAEIAYALFPEYWNKGIGQSVLNKMIKKWGPEVRKIGLWKGFDENNKYQQKIKNKFQCFGGKELKKFYATARPVNISSWRILEKTGFKPKKTGVENLNNPIDFNENNFELPSSENLFEYYRKVEFCIEKLYQNNNIKIDKIYCMISNNKLHTFNKKNDGRIRFHYEREVN